MVGVRRIRGRLFGLSYKDIWDSLSDVVRSATNDCLLSRAVETRWRKGAISMVQEIRDLGRGRYVLGRGRVHLWTCPCAS